MQKHVLLSLCLIGIFLNLFTQEKYSSANSFILFTEGVLLCVTARMLINHSVNKGGQERFYNSFLLSFFLSLILLYFCWTPYLYLADAKGGFDPQRYYLYAIEYVNKGDFTGWVGGGLNGVVYMFAYIMMVFGIDPLVPLYFNIILLLIEVLWMYRIFCHYCCKGRKYVPYLLLIPEVVYYNVMTSKETLCMFGATWIVYELFVNSTRRSLLHIFMLLLAMAFELYVRATFAVIIVFAYLLFLIFGSSQMSITKKAIAMFVMIVGIYIGFTLGSSFITQDTVEEYQELAVSAASGDNESTFDVSESSLSGKLVPHNQVEMVVFGFLRAILYLMPDTSIVMAFLKDPTLFRFGPFTQLFTGGLMALFIPLVFLSIWKAKKMKIRTSTTFSHILVIKKMNIRTIAPLSHILVVIKKLKIGTFTPLSYILVILILFVSFSRPGMVHQRYRIVYDCMYFFSSILAIGYFPNKFIKRVMHNWLLLIMPLALILLLYKFMS